MGIGNPILTANLSASVASANPTITGSTGLSDTTRSALPVGSAAGSADGAFSVVGSATAGTPASIDLTALKDPFGQPLTIGHLVVLKVTNAGSAGNLTVGGGTNAAVAALPVPLSPGSTAVVHDAGGTLIPVAAGSTQYLQIAASAGTVPFTVSGLTRSA